MARFQVSFDESAFGELVARYRRPAMVVAQGLMPGSSTVEDVVQEAFVRVARRRDQYDGTRRFAPWFYAILRNACADQRRRQATYLRVLGEVADQSAILPPGEPVCGGMEELLQSLPEDDRQIIILKVVHGMTFREVAKVAGCTEEAAKKRAQRALRRLHEARLSSGQHDVSRFPGPVRNGG